MGFIFTGACLHIFVCIQWELWEYRGSWWDELGKRFVYIEIDNLFLKSFKLKQSTFIETHLCCLGNILCLLSAACSNCDIAIPSLLLWLLAKRREKMGSETSSSQAGEEHNWLICYASGLWIWACYNRSRLWIWWQQQVLFLLREKAACLTLLLLSYNTWCL